MKIDFSNATNEDQRIKLKPKNGAVSSMTTTNTNPTLGIDEETGDVTFCLSPPKFSCAGATSESGELYLKGNFDIIVDGVKIADNVKAEDFPDALDGTFSLVATQITMNEEIPPIYENNMLPNPPVILKPWDGIDDSSNPDFGAVRAGLFLNIPRPANDKISLTFNATGLNSGAFLQLNVNYDLSDSWLNEEYINASDFFIRVSPADSLADMLILLIEVVNTSTDNVKNDVVFKITSDQFVVSDVLNLGFVAPVEGLDGEDFSDFISVLDNELFVAHLGNIDIVTEQFEPIPPVEPIPETPPVGIRDWIALDNADHFVITLNDVTVSPDSARGLVTNSEDYKISRNANHLAKSLNDLGLEAHCYVNPNDYKNTLYIKNTSFEHPIKIVLTVTSNTIRDAIAVSPLDQNGTLVEGTNESDQKTYSFWLSELSDPFSDLEMVFESNPTNNDDQNLVCMNFGLSTTLNTGTIEGYIKFTVSNTDTGEIVYSNDYPNGIRPYDLTQLGGLSGLYSVDKKYYNRETGLYLQEDGWLLWENIKDIPLTIVFQKLIPGSEPINPTIEFADEYWSNEQFVIVKLAKRKLRVAINDNASNCSVNLRSEFTKKYPIALNQNIEVDFYVTSEIMPAVTFDWISRNDGHVPRSNPSTSSTYLARTSGIFVGSTPRLKPYSGDEKADDIGRWGENELHDPVFFYRTVDTWISNCKLNLHILGRVYGLGGVGGNHRLESTGEWTKNGGRGYPAIHNHCTPDQVSLNVFVADDGMLLSGGGGGAAPAKTLLHVNYIYLDEPGGRQVGMDEPLYAPNYGGIGGAPNGCSGVFMPVSKIPRDMEGYGDMYGGTFSPHIPKQLGPSYSVRGLTPTHHRPNLFLRTYNVVPDPVGTHFEPIITDDSLGALAGEDRFVETGLGFDFIYPPVPYGFVVKSRFVEIISESYQIGGPAGYIVEGEVNAIESWQYVSNSGKLISGTKGHWRDVSKVTYRFVKSGLYENHIVDSELTKTIVINRDIPLLGLFCDAVASTTSQLGPVTPAQAYYWLSELVLNSLGIGESMTPTQEMTDYFDGLEAILSDLGHGTIDDRISYISNNAGVAIVHAVDAMIEAYADNPTHYIQPEIIFAVNKGIVVSGKEIAR